MLFCAIPINAATVIGSVLTTDIKAYINGCEVPSYNIDGNIVVVGQDLRSYGFNVVYDNNTRTSFVSYDGSGTWTPIAPSIENSQSIGTKVMDVYQSDISVSVNGNKVACYNVGGKMAFRFAELKVFGNYSYDNETRSVNLWVGETKSNEIDNVSAVASSSVANDFENIYIDESGNLIFELSNGSVINAGAVLNGKDGRDGQDGESGRNGLNGRDGADGEDGVSIVNAYVDSEGDLIVELSNHKVINAGNVGSNYSADKLTFADYEVGTKFYLTQPTGEFSVTVNVNDTPYLVGFTDIYYELTAKHDFSDEDAWIYKDYKTQFVPYEIELHIEGFTNSSLAGRQIDIALSGLFGGYSEILPDGSFSIVEKYYSYNEPVFLYFKSVTIEEMEDDGKDDKVIKELISYFAGTWTSPDEPDNVIVLKEDGTIIENDVEYTPSFYLSGKNNEYLNAEFNGVRARFKKYKCDYLDKDGYSYYRDGTWSAISLGTENFFDYFEYKENFTVIRNAFGEWSRADISRYYTLKDEYKLLYEYENNSNAAVKVKVDTYRAEYTLDFENETYTVDIGEFYETDSIVKEGVNGSGIIIHLKNTTFWSDENLRTYYYIFDLIDATGTLYLSTNTDR